MASDAQPLPPDCAPAADAPARGLGRALPLVGGDLTIQPSPALYLLLTAVRAGTKWIPDDPTLWKVENFRAFLDARKALLAAELNRRMEELLHGDTQRLTGPAVPAAPVVVAGGITGEDEERQLEDLNAWIEERGLPRGVVAFDFADAATGEQKAVLDLAWPTGIQEELSQPVAVLLNEPSEVLAIASQAGFRCFVSVAEFKKYVDTEILAQGVAA